MSFDIAAARDCRCGGRPVLWHRSEEMDGSKEVFEWLQCDACGMRSPEDETTQDRSMKLERLAEVWDKVMAKDDTGFGFE